MIAFVHYKSLFYALLEAYRSPLHIVNFLCTLNTGKESQSTTLVLKINKLAYHRRLPSNIRRCILLFGQGYKESEKCFDTSIRSTIE